MHAPAQGLILDFKKQHEQNGQQGQIDNKRQEQCQAQQNAHDGRSQKGREYQKNKASAQNKSRNNHGLPCGQITTFQSVHFTSSLHQFILELP